MVQEHCSLRKMVSAMQYKDDFDDPRWHEFRRKIYSRDKYKCTNPHCTEIINTKNPLQAHHWQYQQKDGERLRAWEYHEIFVKTLCKRCHEVLKDVEMLVRCLNSKGVKYINRQKHPSNDKVIQQLKIDRKKRRQSNA